MATDLTDLVEQLRASGGDTLDVEVKLAAGGLPESLTETLSALANHPGGGVIVLGLDEATDFRPVRLPNRHALKQGLGAKARHYVPPVRVVIDDAVVDGEPVVVATVHECDPSMKPCRVEASGKAYLRSYDGDYEMSQLEEQAFLAARQPPHFDRRVVEGATRADLDDDLLGVWAANARARSAGLSRFDDAELLVRTGVTAPDGVPTVAGLLCFGVHPQQWFPRFVIQAAEVPEPAHAGGIRARSATTIDGPIPTMLDGALEWARQTFPASVVSAPDGTVRDRFEYPLDAFRELVANALIHRDLDAWSEGLAVEIRRHVDRLTVVNPGGLYGITVDRLGRDHVTSARNARLINLCQDARSPRSGARVVEALATGIQAVASSLEAAGLPPARYFDAGIRFTALLRSAPPAPVGSKLQAGSTAGRVYAQLAGGALSVNELEAALGIAGPTIRKALRELRRQGLVDQHGGQGRRTVYERRST